MPYRDTFYEVYFQQQAGRNTLSNSLEKKLEWDYKIYMDELSHLLPVNRSVSILDLGAGYGSLCHWLQHKGYKNVKAIDTSPEQVQRAKDLGVSVELCDVQTALDREDTYDCIFAIDFIEHFDKEELVELLGARREHRAFLEHLQLDALVKHVCRRRHRDVGVSRLR